MIFDDEAIARMTEQDVREEIIAPIIYRLGYKFGEQNFVERERKLRHPFTQIGHKSARDVPVGAADYICGVDGRRGAFTVEAKRGNHPLEKADIIQAHSYAAHFEVGARYFVLCNGKEFQVFETLGDSERSPKLSLSNNQIEKEFARIEAILSPASLRQDTLVRYKPKQPLAIGYQSRIGIKNGWIRISNIDIWIDHPLSDQIMVALDGAGVREKINTELSNFVGQRQPVINGHVSRDQSGKIFAELEFDSHDEGLSHNMESMGVRTMIYETDSELISTDPEKPTIFETNTQNSLAKGTILYSALSKQLEALEQPLVFHSYYRALGSLRDNIFSGKFVGRGKFVVDGGPAGKIDFLTEAEGVFDLNLLEGTI